MQGSSDSCSPGFRSGFRGLDCPRDHTAASSILTCQADSARVGTAGPSAGPCRPASGRTGCLVPGWSPGRWDGSPYQAFCTATRACTARNASWAERPRANFFLLSLIHENDFGTYCDIWMIHGFCDYPTKCGSGQVW